MAHAISLESTVAELVTSRLTRARLFETLGINYCCGGGKSLAMACREKGLNPVTVLDLIAKFDEQVRADDADRSWTTASLVTLVDHIEQRHHAYLKAELPRLEGLVAHVAARHGSRDAHLVSLRDLFLPLAAELRARMTTEEEEVFPACRAFEQGTAGPGHLSDRIPSLIQENQQVGEVLSRIRSLTHGFVPPAGACNTYRVMYAGLADLVEDMHRHVHKENNVLFPRVLEAARKAAEAVA